MKITIEIEDNLDEIVEMAIEEIKDYALDYIKENNLTRWPEWSDLDHYGTLNEFIDSSVPIYHSQIRDLWYLYKYELEEAYEREGLGDNPLDNHGMVAIYCLIAQRAREWFNNEAEDYNEMMEDKEQEEREKEDDDEEEEDEEEEDEDEESPQSDTTTNNN